MLKIDEAPFDAKRRVARAGAGWLVAQLANAHAARLAVEGRLIDEAVCMTPPIGLWRVPLRPEVVVRQMRGSTRFGFLAGVPGGRTQRVQVERPVFPGYAFVQPFDGYDGWGAIERAAGVERLLGPKGSPAWIEEARFAALVAAVTQAAPGEGIAGARLRVAMLVRICAGPFASFNGVIEAIDGACAERVTVGVGMFGRVTRVKMDGGDVEPVD